MTSGTPPQEDLTSAFHGAMVQIYPNAKSQAGYNATRFFQMLTEHGGVQSAHRLLPHLSDGFTQLQQRGRLDLTVEALILQPRWATLFTDEERAIARQRLRDCGFEL